jgi:hypothetical protein
MTKSSKLLDLIRAAFPAEPVPVQFFWTEGKDSLDCDIPQELRNRISGRVWPEVALMDWRMTGVIPAIGRRYLEPRTFMYYLPSIIVGASQEIEFMEFALHAMIPYNSHHVPRGAWWFEFVSSASPRQRAALSAFLVHTRIVAWDRIGSANQYFLEHAEGVWSS